MTATRTQSMQKFTALTRELQAQLRTEAIAELNQSADDLVAQMQSVAPVGRTGNLRRSIRKEPGKTDTRVKIVAGGPLTTVKGTRAGAPAYDYANAQEFGTREHGAKPFFWPSWRLRRKKIRSRMKRRITANIKKRSADG